MVDEHRGGIYAFICALQDRIQRNNWNSDAMLSCAEYLIRTLERNHEYGKFS